MGMKPMKYARWTALVPLVMVAALEKSPLRNPVLQVQAAETGRAMPVFEVDHAWPKVPPQWKLGDASSIALDAQDNVGVLHRPRTLKPAESAKAAPPIIVFDTAGNYIK